MNDPIENDVREVDPSRVLPVVVGAHLEAERHDRPLATGLLRALQTALGPEAAIEPMVITDLWYLNDPLLRTQPTLAIGRPEVNAASAYLAGRLPTALLVEHRFRIQIDPELLELDACMWGVNPVMTAEAMGCFVERYLEDYAEGVRLLAPAG